MPNEKENSPKNKSLALTCFKILFGLYFLCTVIITIIQMYATYYKAEENITKEIRTTYASISDALILSVHNLNESLVFKLLDGLVSTPQIEASVILDEQNEVYALKGIKKEKDASLYKTKKFPGLVKVLEQKLYYTDKYNSSFNEKVGNIFIYRSEGSILLRVKDGFYYLVIAAFLKTICLGFIFFWVFKKWLIKPLSNLIKHAESINLENLNKISLGLTPSEKNELHILENSLNSMIENIQDSKEEITQKNEELSESYRNLFSLSEELKALNKKITANNINLQDEVDEANNELQISFNKTEAMLHNVNKAIFVTDSKGIVQAPVSKHCETLFKRDIIGENGLKLLFFHLKDHSEEKKLIINAWNHIFGKEKSQFLSVESHFPRVVIHPDTNKKRGRHLRIAYAPLIDKSEKINNLMFLVDDITDETLEKLKTKKEGRYYHIIMEILPVSNKEKLITSIAGYLTLSVSLLEEFLSPESERNKLLRSPEYIKKTLIKGKDEVFQPLSDFQSLLKSIIRDFENLDSQKILFSIKAITQIIELLNTYLEVFDILNKNKIGPEVNFAIPKRFENSVEEKIQDLHRLMTNILEYVFLVRNIEDLDKEKIENAPKKAKLYGEFDKIIELLMKRSQLISYILKVVGKTEKSQAFYNLSELLKQMPSKDKLTEAALVNHLVTPYADIRKA